MEVTKGGCTVWFISAYRVEVLLVQHALHERGDEVVWIPPERLPHLSSEVSQPDLILITFRLLDLDGFEVHRHLKNISSLHAIPVLFWRVAAPKELYQRALEEGIAGYLELVCSLEELLDARDRVLNGELYYPILKT